jgi:hypothetical protein
MWDKYLPRWRAFKNEPKKPRDPEEDKRTVEKLKQMSDSPELRPGDENAPMDSADYVALKREIWPRKGKWLRFSEDQIRRMQERDDPE